MFAKLRQSNCNNASTNNQNSSNLRKSREQTPDEANSVSAPSVPTTNNAPTTMLDNTDNEPLTTKKDFQSSTPPVNDPLTYGNYIPNPVETFVPTTKNSVKSKDTHLQKGLWAHPVKTSKSQILSPYPGQNCNTYPELVPLNLKRAQLELEREERKYLDATSALNDTKDSKNVVDMQVNPISQNASDNSSESTNKILDKQVDTSNICPHLYKLNYPITVDVPEPEFEISEPIAYRTPIDNKLHLLPDPLKLMAYAKENDIPLTDSLDTPPLQRLCYLNSRIPTLNSTSITKLTSNQSHTTEQISQTDLPVGMIRSSDKSIDDKNTEKISAQEITSPSMIPRAQGSFTSKPAIKPRSTLKQRRVDEDISSKIVEVQGTADPVANTTKQANDYFLLSSCKSHSKENQSISDLATTSSESKYLQDEAFASSTMTLHGQLHSNLNSTDQNNNVAAITNSTIQLETNQTTSSSCSKEEPIYSNVNILRLKSSDTTNTPDNKLIRTSTKDASTSTMNGPNNLKLASPCQKISGSTNSDAPSINAIDTKKANKSRDTFSNRRKNNPDYVEMTYLREDSPDTSGTNSFSYDINETITIRTTGNSSETKEDIKNNDTTKTIDGINLPEKSLTEAPVEPGDRNDASVVKLIKPKATVAVLGGAGTLGKQFCTFAILHGFKVLVIGDESENYDYLCDQDKNFYEIRRVNFTNVLKDLEESVFENINCAVSFLCTLAPNAKDRKNGRAIEVQCNLRFAELARNRGSNPFVICSKLFAPTKWTRDLDAKDYVENRIKRLKFNNLLVLRPGVIVSKNPTTVGCVGDIKGTLLSTLSGKKATNSPLSIAACILDYLVDNKQCGYLEYKPKEINNIYKGFQQYHLPPVLN